MQHFLAYGNSDQASFRDEVVRDCFNYMTVPGTIAAYYEDATAAFVLSSQLDYVIDPRTPLYQGRIPQPRASHFSLAAWLSPLVEEHLGDGEDPVTFGPNVYSDSLLAEIVESVVSAQRNYGARSGGIMDKMARYRRLLAEALQRDADELDAIRPPAFVLAPYFVAEAATDDWWERNVSVWSSCLDLDEPTRISPVVAGMSVDVVAALLAEVPAGLSPRTFLWISGFDERRVSIPELNAFRGLVENRAKTADLVNMYGGFFSICMGGVGLWGVNNGLGYSESRAWPELPATGAAPARYYVPRLHSYFTPRLAQLIMDTSADYWCLCQVCQDRVAGAEISIVDLPYHDLKKHFALTRRAEIELVDAHGRAELSQHLRDEAARFGMDVAPQLPIRLRPDIQYLNRWAAVLA